MSDLANVIDFDAIRGSGVHLGVDPLGGSGVHYWAPIAERYGIDLTVVSDTVDHTFRFMSVGPLDLAGIACIVSRSGYTGEDGF